MWRGTEEKASDGDGDGGGGEEETLKAVVACKQTERDRLRTPLMPLAGSDGG